MPRRLQMEFMQTVQRVMDVAGKELTAADLWRLFVREYGVETAQSLQNRVLEEEGEGRQRFRGAARRSAVGC